LADISCSEHASQLHHRIHIILACTSTGLQVATFVVFPTRFFHACRGKMITLSGLLYCSFLSLQQLLQTVTDCWCRCSRPFTGMLVISGGPCPRWLRIWNRSVLSRLWAISASLPLNIPPGVACFLLLAALLHIQFAQQAWYVSGTFALAV
jgi:hypothetical protein